MVFVSFVGGEVVGVVECGFFLLCDRFCFIVVSNFCSVMGFFRKFNVLILVVLMVVLMVVWFDIMMMGMVSRFCDVYFLSSVMLLVFGI